MHFPRDNHEAVMAARSRVLAVVWGGLLLVAWAIPILAYYPGAYTSDSLHQVRQAISGVYDDWHPPLMAAWWRVLFRVTGTPSALLFFNQLLLLIALVLFARVLTKEGERWALVLIVPIPLLPVVVNFSGVLWKDVGCAFALALAVTAATLMPARRGRTACVLAVVVGCYYAAGIRLNAVPAVFPVLLLAFWPSRRLTARGGRPRLRAFATALTVTVACAVAPPIFGYEVLGARTLHVSGVLKLTDLAALRHHTGVDAIPTFSLSTQAVTPDQVELRYRKSDESGSANFLFFKDQGNDPPLRLPRDDAESAALTRAWIETALRHPAAYLRHRAAFMGKLLRIGEPTGYFHYVLPQDRADLDQLLRDAQAPDVQREVLEDLEVRAPCSEQSRAVVTWIIASSAGGALFLGWCWVVLELLLLALSAALHRRKPRLAVFVATSSASGLLYCASYFPLTPAPDFRYLYWTVLAGVLATVAAVAATGSVVFRNTKTLLRPS